MFFSPLYTLHSNQFSRVSTSLLTRITIHFASNSSSHLSPSTMPSHIPSPTSYRAVPDLLPVSPSPASGAPRLGAGGRPGLIESEPTPPVGGPPRRVTGPCRETAGRRPPAGTPADPGWLAARDAADSDGRRHRDEAGEQKGRDLASRVGLLEGRG